MIMYGGGRQDATWDAREVPRPPLPHHCNALTTPNFTNSVWKTFYPGNQHLYLLTSKIQCQFLPDPSPIIDWLPLSLTNSLIHYCLVDLIDVTLVCEDAYSKLVEVVTVADVSYEDRVGNSLLQIWKLRFGHKARLLFRL